MICSSKLSVFLELCSQKTVHFSEQIMPLDKYLSICLQVPLREAIVYRYNIFQLFLSRLTFSPPGCLSVLSPGKAVTKLRVGKFMKATFSSYTEVAPDIFHAAKIQLFYCTTTRFKALKKSRTIFWRCISKVHKMELSFWCSSYSFAP